MSTTPTPKRFGRFITRHGVDIIRRRFNPTHPVFQRFSQGGYATAILDALPDLSREALSPVFDQLFAETYGVDCWKSMEHEAEAIK